MAEESRCKIRVRWPSGAEFEAEGGAEFVARESRELIGKLEHAPAPAGPPGPETAARVIGKGPRVPEIHWDSITEMRGPNIQLRAKLRGAYGEREACLVLLACSEKLLRQPKPTATLLAKWLRRSGYPVTRMDRALQEAIAQGELLSSGSRRSRRYELSSSGRLKALLLAEELSGQVSDRP